MAVATKTQLKDVFAGLSSIMFQSSNIVLAEGATLSILPELELPVHIDDLSINQDEPDINHYKVHGLNADWCSTATPGDVSISMLVPTMHDNVISVFYGTGVSVSATTTEAGALVAGTFSGKAYSLEAKKISGSVILLNDEKNKLFVIANASLWASLVYENGSTDPIAVRLTGTIEAATSGADIALLEKQ